MIVSIREWLPSDVDSIAKRANCKDIADNLRNIFPHPYTKEDARRFIDFCVNADKTKNLLLAVDVDGEAVGAISLFIKEDVNSKCAELGYWLGKDYWNKGIMSKAVQLICKRGFLEFDIARIYAEIFEYNEASQKVLQKCGFEFEGRLKKSIYKNGVTCDSLVYAVTR